MPLPGGPCLVWAPELPPPQDSLLILSAQVDAQLTGRISQEAERETKVETVRGRRSQQWPQAALPALRKPLEKETLRPCSSHLPPLSWTELRICRCQL